MKVLQTLGRHRGEQEGIFQYRRQADGVHIDSSVGQAALTPQQILITHDEWTAILDEIRSCQQGSFRLSGHPPYTEPPNQSVYELLTRAVPNPAGPWNWNDSWKAYVAAVLEHEGTIDLYHGPLGPQHTAIITLAKDI